MQGGRNVEDAEQRDCTPIRTVLDSDSASPKRGDERGHTRCITAPCTGLPLPRSYRCCKGQEKVQCSPIRLHTCSHASDAAQELINGPCPRPWRAGDEGILVSGTGARTAVHVILQPRCNVLSRQRHRVGLRRGLRRGCHPGGCCSKPRGDRAESTRVMRRQHEIRLGRAAIVQSRHHASCLSLAVAVVVHPSRG